MKRVLVTGGAGFIGSHVADLLLQSGYQVRIYDNLCPQVHPGGKAPDYLNTQAEFVRGDIRDAEGVAKALKGCDAVVHLVAAVGVGQSMYEINHYTDVNNRGTAVLLEALMKRPVERMLVASSMSIYGEGLYERADGHLVEACERPKEQLVRGEWETCGDDGMQLYPMPTPEQKQPCLSSVYALSKYDQERLCLMIGKAYDIPTTALRFFNVYGPRQALSNPYTGVLAIFSSRLLNDKPPLIFEDGLQKRDFVSVYDIARACKLALETPEAEDEVVNIGSGRFYTIREIAERIADVLNKSIAPEISGQYRVGDIRHCYADITKARELLGYEPAVDLDDGLGELAEWLEGQTAEDRAEEATAELSARGLTI